MAGDDDQMHGGRPRCIEEEKKCLLELKAWLISTVIYLNDDDLSALKSYFLPSWVDHMDVDDPTAGNCCNGWVGVTCDPLTGHVLELSLNLLDEFNPYNFNSTWNGSTRFEKWSTLKRLENLHIHNTGLDATFLSPLSTIKSLRVLDLSQNSIFIDDFSTPGLLDKLQQLQGLNMSGCGLTTKGVRSLSLSKMVNLTSLDLSYNHLGKDVLMELDVIPSLKFLTLSGNHFEEGPITNEDLIGFHHLEILNLADCGLNGSIPAQSICKMNKLQELDLSFNDFVGGLPTCLNELSFLRRLNVVWNQWNETFSFSTFANCSKLDEVRIDNLVIETELAEWVPTFQLKTLILLNCSLKFAKFLFFQKDLSHLDLSYNRLEGSFPTWLIVNNTRLDYLNLRDNNFGGYLRDLPHTMNQIRELDISNNHLKGHIPANIDQFLPLLSHMDISFNAFDGVIPRSLGNMSYLKTLVMSNNDLDGEVPIEIMSINSLVALDLSSNNLTGCFYSNLSHLNILDISHNKMSGYISRPTINNYMFILNMRDNSFSGLLPCELLHVTDILDISYNSFTGELSACSGFNNLTYLNLYGNKFKGLVPETILNSSSLITLDIGNNFFSGRIPNLIYEESQLQILLFGGNRFNGAIPHQLCKLHMLNVLDLSRNSFSGSIPTCFGKNFSFGASYSSNLNEMFVKYSDYQFQYYFSYKLEVVFLSKHRIDSYTGKPLELMSELDLSSNYLEGKIPDALGNLSFIRSLNLSNNRLSGLIPQTFSNLMKIESLDLSHNNLSGEIPSKLVNLNFMGTFSVAYNNLSGRLPERKGQFGNFEEDSYAGNPFLCGPPLKKGCEAPAPVKNDDNDEHGYEAWYAFIDIEGFLASFMATYIMYILAFMTVLWINTRWRIWWFNFIVELWFLSYYFLSDILYKCFRVRI